MSFSALPGKKIPPDNRNGPRPPGRRQLLLTRRGLFIAIVLLVLVSGPVREADIVASSLVAGFVCLVASLCLLVLGQALWLRRHLRLESITADCEGAVSLSGTDSHLLTRAGWPTRLLLRTSAFRVVWPCLLECRVHFEHPGIEPACHRLSGMRSTSRLIAEDLSFPHRGIWRALWLECRFSDWPGLFSLSWNQPLVNGPAEFEILPASISLPAQPVWSSRQRAGDEISDIDQRLGDPFDLKPYHPADGMRRILWKAYAKTGELISRHPEKSMTPEGQTLVYCMATTAQDRVAAATSAYLLQLEELSIEVQAGSTGMTNQPLAGDAASFERLSMETAWDCPDVSSAASQLQVFLDQANKNQLHRRLEQMVLFADSESFMDRRTLESLRGAMGILSAAGVAPVLMLIETIEKQQAAESAGRSRAIFHSFFWQDRQRNAPANKGIYQEFLGICARQGWQTSILNLPGL